MSCNHCHTSSCEGGPSCPAEVDRTAWPGVRQETEPTGAEPTPVHPDGGPARAQRSVVIASILVGILADIGLFCFLFAPTFYGRACLSLAVFGALLTFIRFRTRLGLQLLVTGATTILPLGAFMIYFCMTFRIRM